MKGVNAHELRRALAEARHELERAEAAITVEPHNFYELSARVLNAQHHLVDLLQELNDAG